MLSVTIKLRLAEQFTPPPVKKLHKHYIVFWHGVDTDLFEQTKRWEEFIQ